MSGHKKRRSERSAKRPTAYIPSETIRNRLCILMFCLFDTLQLMLTLVSFICLFVFLHFLLLSFVLSSFVLIVTIFLCECACTLIYIP